MSDSHIAYAIVDAFLTGWICALFYIRLVNWYHQLRKK